MEFKTSTLYYRANKYRKQIIDEEEIEQENISDIFYKELEEMVKNGEIIIININAKMRLGKSTAAMALGNHIYELLKKNGYQPKNTNFNISNIARDQQEYSQLMRNPKTQFTSIVVDESNELETTGENSTTEQALLRVFSDVQAGRYVHTVWCSPKQSINENADIHLSVVAIDKKTMTTHAKLYYQFYEGGENHTVHLGYIIIDVKPIIQNWEKNIKRIYYKLKRTPTEQEKLDQAIKNDWYCEYITKKYEKMELITKHGIFRPRALDNSEIVNSTITQLKKLAKVPSALTKSVIRSYIKQEARKHKQPMSIVGEELATQDASAILDLYKDYHKIAKSIRNPKNIGQEKMLKELLDELGKAIGYAEEQLQLCMNIRKQYHQKISKTKQ